MRDSSTMDRPVDRRPAVRRRRWAVVAVVGFVALFVGFVYPSLRRWMSSERSIELSRVRIAEVTRGDLVREIAVDGRIVAAFHPTLFSSTQGIARLLVKAGEVVTVGQDLAQISSPELESRLEQERSRLLALRANLERQQILAAQASLQRRQAIGLQEVELEAARRAMDRAQRSRDEGILNAVEYEKAQDDVRVAELKLEVARKEAGFEEQSLNFEVDNWSSQVESQHHLVVDLERQVESLALRSPVDGLVSRLEINDQDAVERNQPLVTVVDLSAFEVEVLVPENYADDVVPPVTAMIRYEGADYEGVVKSISPEVEGSRVKGFVSFLGEAPQGLKQNQRVSTRLILEKHQNVRKVERGPFVEDGGGRIAYVVEDGMAVKHAIEVGSLSITEVEIRSGLEIGDRIIVSDIARFEGAERVLLRR